MKRALKKRFRVVKATCLGLIATCCSLLATSQDIHFSQFFEAPLLRNPSLAGIFAGDIRVQAVYRDQWNSVTTAYKTVSLNGEYKMPVGNANDFVTVEFAGKPLKVEITTGK